MSEVRSTFALNDQLTGPLQNIINALDSTIQSMEHTSNSTDSFESSIRDLNNLTININMGNMASVAEHTEAMARNVEEDMRRVRESIQTNTALLDSMTHRGVALNLGFGDVLDAQIAMDRAENTLRQLETLDPSVDIRVRNQALLEAEQSAEELAQHLQRLQSVSGVNISADAQKLITVRSQIDSTMHHLQLLTQHKAELNLGFSEVLDAQVAMDRAEDALRHLDSLDPTVDLTVRNQALLDAEQSVQELNLQLQRIENSSGVHINADTHDLIIARAQIESTIGDLRGLTQRTDLNVNADAVRQAEAALDSAEAELRRLNGLDLTINTNLNDVQAAHAQLARLQAELNSLRTAAAQAEQEVDELEDDVEDLGKSARGAGSAVTSLWGAFAGAVGAYLSVSAITDGFKSFIAMSDQATSLIARLDMVNDGLQTTAELQDMIFASAQNSLADYNQMANLVGKLAMNAKDAFSGNQEVIQFAELLNKQFSIAGTSAEGVAAATLQLTQALGGGVLRGEELNSIFEQSPNIIHTIADYLDVPIGKIREMATEGQITADVVKAAMFNAADDINKKFNEMPYTFGDIATTAGNNMKRAFQPAMDSFKEFVNSDTFSKLANYVVAAVVIMVGAFHFLLNILITVADWVVAIADFFSNHWSIIAPILMTIGIVLGSIVTILAVKYAILGLVRVATLAWAAAQWVVNAAYLSNPIVWVLIAIIAVIALVVYALVVWGEQTAVVIGFIVGLFAALFAFIYNNVANLANFFLSFAEFLINLFIDPVYAIKKLFYDMAMTVMNNMAAMGVQIDSVANAIGNAFVSGANMAIGAINWIVDALNNIPGISLGKVGQVSMSGSGLGSKIANFAKNLEAPTSNKNVVSLPRMDLMNYADTFNSASDWAYNGTMAISDSLNGLVDKAKGLVGEMTVSDQYNLPTDTASLLDGLPDLSAADAANQAGKNAKDAGKVKGGKLDSVGKIEDDLSLDDKSLEILKELATRKSIQNFITLTPTVQVSGVTVREEADVNKLVKKIEKNLSNEIARSTKGVYGLD